MTFKVVIIFSSIIQDVQIINEFVNALHKYGIEATVPWRTRVISEEYEQVIYQLIQSSDCVLVIIGLRRGYLDNVDYEIELARKLSRQIIPIVERGANIPHNLRDEQHILIDRTQPKLSYENAAKYLNSLKMKKEEKRILGGLLLVGIGLVILAALSSEE